jgi:hypothetical protein
MPVSISLGWCKATLPIIGEEQVQAGVSGYKIRPYDYS